jgi:hypothetical protein
LQQPLSPDALAKNPKQMKKPIHLLLLFFLCLTLPWQAMVKKPTSTGWKNEQELEWEDEEHEGEEGKESGVEKQLMSWFWARAYPDPYYLNDKYMQAWEQAQAIRKQQSASRALKMQSGLWNSIGPSASIGGRILTIAIDPVDGQRLFAGSAGGGIWKSTNGGTNWTSVTTDWPVLGVASIIIHPTDANIIYAGTGEVYRVDSTGGAPNPGNTGFNVWKTRGTYGIGVLKSSDGGAHWSKVLARTSDQLFAVQTLKFDAVDPDIVYACATDGLYRTVDAGAHWTKLVDAAYVSDVEASGSTIVAAAGNLDNTVKGIYRSTDSGVSWTKITSGLPASFNGFIKFDCVATDPNTIVASIGVDEATPMNSSCPGNCPTELFRSTNFGTSWTGLSGSGHTNWQYWCAHDVAINPSATNKLVYGGVKWYNYNMTSGGAASITTGHDDLHDIQFDPSNNSIVYICCDGGVWKSTNSGVSFSSINNGLAATQFYASLGVSTTDPNVIIGGLQDNGAVIYNGSSWSKLGWVGGDGTSAAIDPSNDNNMLASRDARGIYRSTDGGGSGGNVADYWGQAFDSRTAFCAPIAFSRSNSSIVYAASDNLHKSTNGGASFSYNAGGSTANNYIEAIHKTAITLAVSPNDPNKIYVSTSPFAQYDNDIDNLYLTGYPNVLRTTTGNTPFASRRGTGADTLPRRFIMDFAISKGNDDSVFVAVGGFGTQHIYVTGDGGLTWKGRGLGLPDVPFNAVLIDPVDPKIIYAGGDFGVYASPDRGINWYDFNMGMWDATQVMDLQATSDNQLLAATHGKGVFRGARFSGTLPVNILSFTGTAETGYNRLAWEVSQEINISRYEIERSPDGNSFQGIGQVRAANATAYSYSDASIDNRSYYYRLKSVDQDGRITYSAVVLIQRTAKQVLQVAGNPFTNAININLNLARNSKAQISLYDAGGKLIRRERIDIGAGQSSYSIQNLGGLPAGSYFIEAIFDNQRWKQQLLKK